VTTAQAEPIAPIEALGEWLNECAHDPTRFVMEAFPWGEGELKNFPDGPMEWQRWVLQQIQDGLRVPGQPIKIAVASGHGVGKTAACAWLILWAMSTAPDMRGVVTASTEMMLTTRLRAELRKWFRLFRAAAFFELTATALLPVDGNRDTWRVDLVPWNANRPESFAGLHNAGRRILCIQDEASAIDRVIWDTIQPITTDRDAEVVWLAFGNPLHPEGPFRDCFAEGTDWITRHIDSRSVPITNKVEFQRWIAAYGEDSDFVLARVRGIFPRQAFNRFISPDVVDAAMQRDAEMSSDPLVMGVDVARFGDDMSVIYMRKGMDARTYPPMKFRNLSLDRLEDKVVELCAVNRVEMVFVDGTGVGGGLVDHLQRRRLNVYDVQFGRKADQRRERYANKRAEIWGIMKDKLQYLSLPRDSELREQLIGPEFTLNSRDEILLEPKDSMKRRGVASPDIADALACTFACEYATLPAREWDNGRGDHLVRTWHDPFSPEYMNDVGMQPRLQAPRYYAEGWARLRDEDAA
jgi:hypothetical protein